MLSECLTRFPDDYDATRELFLFGLEKTNVWDIISEKEQIGSEIQSERSPTKKEAECLKQLDVKK